MCTYPLVIVHFDSFERNEQLATITRIFIGNLATACYSCGWFCPAAGYKLWLSRVLAAGCKLRLSRVPAAGYKLQLTRVPAAWYRLRPTPYHGWLEFQQLDTSYSWLHPTAHSSSGGWIRLKADSILRLSTSCGWSYSAADSSPPAGLDLRPIYTLIYQVILRTYSAKYIIFMVYFLPTDFSYHWSRLWLLLQEAWKSLRKLEEAWRNLKKLQEPSCNWF